jgi:hypothetical protein
MTAVRVARSRRRVRHAAQQWLGAVADGAADAACARMSEGARAQLIDRSPVRDCAEAIRQIAAALGPRGQDEVRAMTVATVRLRACGVAVVTLAPGAWELELRRLEGRWLIADLMSTVRAGTGGAYPPVPRALGSARQ